MRVIAKGVVALDAFDEGIERYDELDGRGEETGETLFELAISFCSEVDEENWFIRRMFE